MFKTEVITSSILLLKKEYSESDSGSNSLSIFPSIFSKSESKSDSESDFNSVFKNSGIFIFSFYIYTLRNKLADDFFYLLSKQNQ